MEARKYSSNRQDWSLLEQFIDSKVARPPLGSRGAHKTECDLPGAVIYVGLGGELVYSKAFGCRALTPEPSAMFEEVVFDIGELTQALITTTLCMKLIDRGALEVDRKLSRVFQSFGILGKERMTVRHLLNHTSGYPVNIPFFRRIAKADQSERMGMMSSRGAVEEVYTEIFRAKLDNIPGKVMKPSDVGFMLLGHAIEIISGTPIDKFAQRSIFLPLELRSTGFVKLSSLKKDKLEPVSEVIAPTGHCSWRNKQICGQVFDENAWAMGGVAGHAGLFSTADDIFKLVNELADCWHGRSPFLSRGVIEQFWRRDSANPDDTWALGWNTAGFEGSAAGRHFSRFSVGRESRTGCSVWMDLERDLSVLLLSNQHHAHPEGNRTKEIVPIINDLVVEALGLVA